MKEPAHTAFSKGKKDREPAGNRQPSQPALQGQIPVDVEGVDKGHRHGAQERRRRNQRGGQHGKEVLWKDKGTGREEQEPDNNAPRIEERPCLARFLQKFRAHELARRKRFRE